MIWSTPSIVPPDVAKRGGTVIRARAEDGTYLECTMMVRPDAQRLVSLVSRPPTGAECPECGGHGKDFGDHADPCRECDGTGTVDGAPRWPTLEELYSALYALSVPDGAIFAANLQVARSDRQDAPEGAGASLVLVQLAEPRRRPPLFQLDKDGG